MNSTFEKLRIVSDESNRNCYNKLIRYTEIKDFTYNWPNPPEKEAP